MAGTWANDDVGRKWDRCFADAILKLGGGTIVGGIISLFFFKRRMWPVMVGSGFGLGMAYSNCEQHINASLAQCKLKKTKSEDHKQ